MSRIVRFHLCLCFVSLAMVPLSPRLHAATLDNTTNFPDAVSPGETVTIAGKFDPVKQPTAAVKLYHVGTTAIVDTRTGAVTDKSITVKLPDATLPAGRYYLTVDDENLVNQVVPGELRVQANVKLDATHPTTAYANGSGSFDFDVVGQNFSPEPQDDQIYIAGQGSIIAREHRFKEKPSCVNIANWPCLWVESSEKLHVFGYKSEPYQGPLLLSVVVGSVRSAEKPLVLARWSETGVLVASIGLFLAVGLFIYMLVAKGMRANVIGGQRASPFWSFFIDTQTNTYSLSKFQLLMFSSVFVFGYLYVFLCRWLVQWQFILPDVPSSLSGILAMSAGTAVAAAGATAARGSKGAGGVRPSAADFITIGGQVVPERFQFFVWTLVACFGFLALLVSQNPATLDKFPDFPQGLLYVMGVSAAGYLGGKVTRAPGPVIHNIAWDKGVRKLTVQGENLSSKAEFYIDGTKLPINTNAEKKPPALVTPTSQEQLSDASFSSQLIIEITEVAGLDLSTGDHVFRITNNDGQFADASFTADKPAIINVEIMPDPAAGAAPAVPAPAVPIAPAVPAVPVVPAAPAVPAPAVPAEPVVPAAPAVAAPPAAPAVAAAPAVPAPAVPAAPADAPPAPKKIASGQAEVTIRVTGSGFRNGTMAKWTPPKAMTPTQLPAAAVTFVDTTQLTIKLTPGDPGTGTLTVLTPNGLSAMATVTVT